MIKEIPCQVCNKPNDIGIKTCWNCGCIPHTKAMIAKALHKTNANANSTSNISEEDLQKWRNVFRKAGPIKIIVHPSIQ